MLFKPGDEMLNLHAKPLLGSCAPTIHLAGYWYDKTKQGPLLYLSHFKQHRREPSPPWMTPGRALAPAAAACSESPARSLGAIRPSSPTQAIECATIPPMPPSMVAAAMKASPARRQLLMQPFDAPMAPHDPKTASLPLSTAGSAEANAGAEATASTTSPKLEPGSLSPNNRLGSLRAEAALLRRQPSPPQVRHARWHADEATSALSSSTHGFQRRASTSLSALAQKPWSTPAPTPELHDPMVLA